MAVVRAGLTTPNGVYLDIQIWTKHAIPGLESCKQLQIISHVDYTKIPVFLVSNGPFHVYTDEKATQNYLKENLAIYEDKCGLLAKSESQNFYTVLYTDSSLSVWCFVIDFGILDQISKLPSNPEKDVYYTGTNLTSAAKSDTTIFDRVLENKSLKTLAQTVPARPISMLTLNSHQQITQAVTKMVLSGLRLRGLSATVGTTNEKIAVREIYQMTKNAAIFSLRKYKYEFNDSKGQNVRMSDIQDVVERLLEVFIDVESPRETLKSK